MSENTPTETITPRFWVLAGLIAFAVGERLVVHFVPGVLPWNFTPVEAIALFGGAYFADRRLAVIVPLTAMVLADLIIALSLPAAQVRDWYHIAPVIYACIAATAVVAFSLRGRVGVSRVAGYAVGSATFFYLVTNFAVWLGSGMYPLTGAGLAACYVAGIPFYPATLAGTLVWSAVLFGTFELLRRRFPALDAAPAPA